jgi:hypothetical protein
MTLQTIAAALLGPLAPLLASLLVVLASFPALEAIRARLTPGVRGVRRIFLPRTGLAAPRRALLRRRLDGPRSGVRRDGTPAVFGLPLLPVRRLKARPS